MLHIYVDGDNIPIEAYFNFIKEKLEVDFGKEYKLTFFCQTNLIFKYQPDRAENMNIICSKISKKNSCDARILFEAGRLITEDINNKVVIVSNDKIYEEIEDGERIFTMGYDTNKVKKIKISKENILNMFATLMESKDSFEDVFCEDFRDYFKCSSTSEFKTFITKNLPNLMISGNDVMYMKKNS